MSKKDQEVTERILSDIRKQRIYQTQLGHTPAKDAALVDNELLTAASAYIDVSKDMCRTRNLSQVLDRVPLSARHYVEPGGTDFGYKIEPRHRAVPNNWPFSNAAWAARGPRYNLIRAAALIVAELERLERQDRAILQPKRTARERKREAAEQRRYEQEMRDSMSGSSTTGWGTAVPVEQTLYQTSTYTGPSPSQTITIGGVSIDSAGAQFLKSGTF